MATLNSAKRNTSGQLDAGYRAEVRALDIVIDLSTDVTMGTATDDIQLAPLPAGCTIVSMTLQQLEVGTGSGTLVGRLGGVTLTGTLASTAAVGTLATVIPAALPAMSPLAGAELNLLGATATRLTGKVRVVVMIASADRTPAQAGIVARDALL